LTDHSTDGKSICDDPSVISHLHNFLMHFGNAGGKKNNSEEFVILEIN